MSEYKLEYPKPDGRPENQTSDRSISFKESDPDTFKILTYWGYSPTTGEYYAIESTWHFVQREDHARLHLEEVKVKYPRVSWFTITDNPAGSLSDVHLRMAREQYRIRSQKQRCDYLILTPSGEFYDENGSE